MKKTLNIIKNIFTWTLVVLAVLMMIFTIISVNTFDKTDRSIFGYKAFIVLSPSMSSVNGDVEKGYFDPGDLILVEELDDNEKKELKAGDIISYISTNEFNAGETVTHKIRRLATDAEGNPGFITYGTATNTDDEKVVIYDYVVGRYSTTVPGVGTFFNFLKTTPGYIVCIFLPFLLLIVLQGINSIRLFKKYKTQQLKEIEAQREAEKQELEEQRRLLEEDRKKQEELLEKLLSMQAAMGEKPAESAAAATEKAPETTTDKNLEE